MYFAQFPYISFDSYQKTVLGFPNKWSPHYELTHMKLEKGH